MPFASILLPLEWFKVGVFINARSSFAIISFIKTPITFTCIIPITYKETFYCRRILLTVVASALDLDRYHFRIVITQTSYLDIGRHVKSSGVS